VFHQGIFSRRRHEKQSVGSFMEFVSRLSSLLSSSLGNGFPVEHEGSPFFPESVQSVASCQSVISSSLGNGLAVEHEVSALFPEFVQSEASSHEAVSLSPGGGGTDLAEVLMDEILGVPTLGRAPSKPPVAERKLSSPGEDALSDQYWDTLMASDLCPLPLVTGRDDIERHRKMRGHPEGSSKNWLELHMVSICDDKLSPKRKIIAHDVFHHGVKDSKHFSGHKPDLLYDENVCSLKDEQLQGIPGQISDAVLCIKQWVLFRRGIVQELRSDKGFFHIPMREKLQFTVVEPKGQSDVEQKLQSLALLYTVKLFVHRREETGFGDHLFRILGCLDDCLFPGLLPHSVFRKIPP
ncbi:unnamed protein product, partial [Cyprideis torosa]